MISNEEIKALFDQLPLSSQSSLLDELLQLHELEGKVLQEAGQEVSQGRKNKPCPHCSSAKVYKRGKQRGVQMYSCKACKKWYSETTGTPLYDINIKKIARELNISIQTSFDWRHKILSSLTLLMPEQLSSEVECDELELALSNKGSKSLERSPRKRGSDFKRNQGKEEVTVVQVVTAVERKGRKYLKGYR